LVYPDASSILETLEQNRDWYQARLSSPSSSSTTGNLSNSPTNINISSFQHQDSIQPISSSSSLSPSPLSSDALTSTSTNSTIINANSAGDQLIPTSLSTSPSTLSTSRTTTTTAAGTSSTASGGGEFQMTVTPATS